MYSRGGWITRGVSCLYYEKTKRELNRIRIHECRCDVRLTAIAEGWWNNINHSRLPQNPISPPHPGMFDLSGDCWPRKQFTTFCASPYCTQGSCASLSLLCMFIANQKWLVNNLRNPAPTESLQDMLWKARFVHMLGTGKIWTYFDICRESRTYGHALTYVDSSVDRKHLGYGVYNFYKKKRKIQEFSFSFSLSMTVHLAISMSLSYNPPSHPQWFRSLAQSRVRPPRYLSCLQYPHHFSCPPRGHQTQHSDSVDTLIRLFLLLHILVPSPFPVFFHILVPRMCLLWINKARGKEKTITWVMVWWKPH
jgi:hypothetical protein